MGNHPTLDRLEEWQTAQEAFLGALPAPNALSTLEAWQRSMAAYLAGQTQPPPPNPAPSGSLPRHRMGVHLINAREGDLQYIERLRPPAVKIVDPDPNVIRRVLAALDPAGVCILRDHPLSEQKSDMKADPIGTGRRHAADWTVKLTTGRFAEFGRDKRIVVCGINEPDVHNQAEETIVFEYTNALLEGLTSAGIRGLALNLSVGWPRNDGDGKPPIWDTFKPLEAIINRGNHFLCTHEYWFPNPQDKWGWYGDRISKCSLNVPIIIGECGYTRQLANLPQPWGWIGNMPAPTYADQLWWYHDNLDPRVFAILPFTSGYASADWAAKDILPAAADILARVHAYPWPTKPTNPPVTPPVVVPPVTEGWQVGDTVAVTESMGVNIRRAPSVYAPKVGLLHYGDTAEITGASQPADGIAWWPIAPGWVAGAVGGVALLKKVIPTLTLRAPFDGHYPITQRFGENAQNYARFGLKAHNGIDFGTPRGTRILAAAAGVVREVENNPPGFGLYVKLIHAWGETLYAHLAEQSVAVGQNVTAGELLGLADSTGNSTGNHLHFGLRINPYNRGDGWQGYSDPGPYLAKA